MIFDVNLRIREEVTEVGFDTNMRIEVKQSENGLYIASCPIESSVIAAGISPLSAILDYLSCHLYMKSSAIENKERQLAADESIEAN